MTVKTHISQSKLKGAEATRNLPNTQPVQPLPELYSFSDSNNVKPIRVLLIDDSEDDYVLTRQMLKSVDSTEFVLDWVCDYDDGEEAILKNSHDVYLVDYRLGAKNGIDLLHKAHKLDCVPSIIMLTGEDSQGMATHSIQLGATDFLNKRQLVAPLLVRSIRYAIARDSFRAQEIVSQELLKEQNTRLSELYATAHQFVDNVSHEFRTPLTVIKEFASILNDGLAGELNEEQSEFAGIIVSSVDDLTLMVNDMLDISRLESGLLGAKRRKHNTKEIVDRVQTTLERKAAASGISLKFSIDTDLPEIYCDAENIGRVIINLGVNACKFCGENGEVIVSARHDPENSDIIYSISDNGPGIAEENVQAIFERFKQVGGDVRAATKGFGLGLNIAQELVQINFGEISVESEISKGSTFSFTVPTFNHAIILERYAKRIRHRNKVLPYASVIIVSAAHDANANDHDNLEQFLERQTRRSELIFRHHPGIWLICAMADQLEMRDMMGRIQDAVNNNCDNIMDDQLPDIEWFDCGTWDLSENTEGFIAAFENQWGVDAAELAASLDKRRSEESILIQEAAVA